VIKKFFSEGDSFAVGWRAATENPLQPNISSKIKIAPAQSRGYHAHAMEQTRQFSLQQLPLSCFCSDLRANLIKWYRFLVSGVNGGG
jgi:hypothetical protein